MTDQSQGAGWWQAADLKWYPPELHADYAVPQVAPSAEQPQQPADLELVATQQRRPGWAPVPPARSADRPPAQIGIPPPPSGQPRKPLAIAAGVVIVVAVAATAGYLLAGRNSQRSITSQPSTMSQPSSSISQPPSPTVAPVAEAALDGLLLSPDQINTAMGATAMTVSTASATMYNDSGVVSDQACLPLTSAGESAEYAGKGWSALRGQELQGPGNAVTYFVQQAVVLFPSAHDAGAFFAASTQSWSACSNRQFTINQDGQRVWTVGPVSNTNGTLSATKTPQGGNGRVCQRALSVANNVAIDIVACSYTAPGAGVNIANQIAAKVPTT